MQMVAIHQGRPEEGRAVEREDLNQPLRSAPVNLRLVGVDVRDASVGESSPAYSDGGATNGSSDVRR